MYCTQCGKKNEDGNAFCIYCGTPMRSTLVDDAPRSEDGTPKGDRGDAQPIPDDDGPDLGEVVSESTSSDSATACLNDASPQDDAFFEGSLLGFDTLIAEPPQAEIPVHETAVSLSRTEKVFEDTILMNAIPSQTLTLVSTDDHQSTTIDHFPCMIGRSTKSPIDFTKHATISRDHAELFEADGRFFVRDNGSMNGTSLNGDDVEKGRPMSLSNGDTLRFADLYFIVIIKDA